MTQKSTIIFDKPMLNERLTEQLNPKNGILQPYTPAKADEWEIYYNLKFKGNICFIVIGREEFGRYFVQKNNETVSEMRAYKKIGDADIKQMQKLIDRASFGYYDHKKTFSEKIKEIVQNRNLGSLMNNTKWCELIKLLKMQDVETMYIQSLREESPREVFWFHFVNTWLDCSAGMYAFKEIEWIFIPKGKDISRHNRAEKLPLLEQFIDLDEFEIKLNQLGQFFYEKDQTGLKIFCYK